MLKTNEKTLPIVSVQGMVVHPSISKKGKMTVDGDIFFIPGTGCITYNAKIGDICVGWTADHLEPGVTTRNPVEAHNDAYVCYSCIGNEAKVISGDAKGRRGIVTGKHGGCEHLMIYFDDETLELLAQDDKILVKSCGQGMALTDYPEIILRNMSPDLLHKMNITEKNGKLQVGVAKIVPGCIMGSGLGSPSASGDYDIALFDETITKQYGLDALRFGDIVCILDADTRYGRTYQTGAVTIGVVIHSDCMAAGHGPGVTTLMSCKTSLIEPVIDEKANLADMFIEK